MANDGASVVATIDGRPMIMDEHITVLEIYEIAGDVDYSTGNIRFDGHVVVQGLVLDDFEIHCRSLEVHGTVGSALIRCEADATFHGGVNGQHRGHIVVGGQCMARYLNEVTIRVDAELKVERGITNSDVACIGSVLAERIVGGTCRAYGGIESKDFGSDLGVTTRLLPGADFQREALEVSIDALREQLFHLDKRRSTITGSQVQDPVQVDASEMNHSNSSGDRQALAQRLDILETTLEAIDQNREAPVAVANVTGNVYADVVVTIKGQSKEFNESRSGKWSIKMSPDTQQIDLDSYRRLNRNVSSPLRKHAAHLLLTSTFPSRQSCVSRPRQMDRSYLNVMPEKI